MISREPTIERLAIARALLLEPFGLDRGHARRHAGRRSRRTASTTPTSTSSTRAAKAGASRKASSRAAASASTRASACAPSPARRRRSPTPTTSPKRRCWTPRAPCARSPPPGQSRRVKVRHARRSLPAAACSTRRCDPIATLDSTQKVALLEKVEKLARARDPRIVQVMAGLAGRVRRGAGRARRRHASPPTCGRWCACRSPSSPSRTAGAARRARRRRRPLRPRLLPATTCIDEYVDAGRQRRAHQPRVASRAGRRDDASCSARAGPACCCTRRSATASRATSTARARAPSPAASASASRPRA